MRENLLQVIAGFKSNSSFDESRMRVAIQNDLEIRSGKLKAEYLDDLLK